MARHVGDDQSLQALFRGVGPHAVASQPFARRVSNAMPIWRREKRFLRSFQEYTFAAASSTLSARAIRF
jgi:hypothetical protein